MSEPCYCPVCGYDLRGLLVSAGSRSLDHHICSCCGTHFSYDDCGRTHAELRDRWVAAGLPWFSGYTPPDEGWDCLGDWHGRMNR